MGTKIVLVGAGSTMFGPSTMLDIFLSEILKGATVVLHDINAERLEIMYSIMLEENKIHGDKVIIEKTTNRSEAFKDADFIINSITNGPRYTHWWQDYEIPRKYGSKQIMGECGGPGGIFQSFRNIPPIVDIAKDAEKICPKALFINYSNPLPYINLAIYRSTKKLKTIGLCHQIAFLKNHIPKMLNKPLEELKITVWGLNHFGFLMGLEDNKSGQDLMPEFHAGAMQYFKEHENKWEFSKLTFEIYKRFGYFPHSGDNHIGEFLQFAHEYVEPQEDYIKRDTQAGDGIYNYFTKHYQKLKEGKYPRKGLLPKSSIGERAVPIIEESIANKNYYELSVNYLNEGFIENLPQDVIIEGPAIVNKDGVHGIKYGTLPKNIAALMRVEASVQDLVVEAVLKRSKELAIAALTINPNVGSFKMAENIFNEMSEKQKQYLPKFT